MFFTILVVLAIPLVHKYFQICDKFFVACQLTIWAIASLFFKGMLGATWKGE